MFRVVTVALFVLAGLVFGGVVDWMTGWAWASFGVASLLFESFAGGLQLKRSE